jgi:hypothetical protein
MGEDEVEQELDVWLSNQQAGLYQPASILEELMLLRRMKGVQFEDITNNPLLATMLPPIPQSSKPAIMLNEGVFKPGRLYIPRYPSVKVLQEFQALETNLVTGNVSLQSSTGKSREKELHYVLMTCWATAARASRAVYPPVGGTSQSIIVRRRDFNTKANPGEVLVSDSIIWQATIDINSQCLGFSDLLVQFSPPIKIPFFAEVRLEVAGTLAGYPVMDSYIGMEVA